MLHNAQILLSALFVNDGLSTHDFEKPLPCLGQAIGMVMIFPLCIIELYELGDIGGACLPGGYNARSTGKVLC